jgi:SAM-dependent methyltransferase
VSEPARAPTHGYDPQYFEQVAAVEDRHFWFVGRNRVLTEVLAEVARQLPPNFSALEIGCGTGNTLRVLEHVPSCGRVVGVDLFLEGLRIARTRSRCSLVCARIEQLPFRHRFDLIALFDVIEHIEHDVEALRHLRGSLAPGGRLVITVPAHPRLWSRFDEDSHHCRRYERRDLEQTLTAAGFDVELTREFMTSLYPLTRAGRALAESARAMKEKLGGTVGPALASELRIVPGVNALLTWLLTREARRFARDRGHRTGTSILAIARPIVRDQGGLVAAIGSKT